MKKFSIFPIHPFLFSAYAVLGVYATNANEIPVAQNLRPLIVILVFTGCIFYVFKRHYKEPNRAGYLTTLVIFWCFYFGHLFFFISYFPFLRELPGKQVLASLAWAGILIGLGNKRVWRVYKNPIIVTRVLNFVSIIVLAVPLFSTAYVAIETNSQEKFINKYQSSQAVPKLIINDNPPDIYYIILDGYGRNDILDEFYGIENSRFTNHLKDEGFYIVDRATSNYMQTELSLASVLNMNYLDYLTDGLGNSQNRGPLNILIHDSLVRKTLADSGYLFTALPSAVLFTQIRNADSFISYSKSQITEFEGLLITKTIVGAFIEDLQIEIPLPNYNTHRKTINFSFETLGNLQKSSKPNFIFTHILAPHPPFVFDEYGNPIQPDRPYFIGDATGFLGENDEYIKGYSREMNYINSQVSLVIDAIKEKSGDNAIIIIHGDHGPGAFTSFVNPEETCLQERFSVLLAIYLPNRDFSKLYSDMSLVNIFPVIFNSYFSAELPIREDRSYYSSWTHPYEFIDITEKIAEKCLIDQ